MDITYDINKNLKNIEKRGLSFELVHELNWNEAIIWEDTRKDYSETRYSALAAMNNRRVYSVVFTLRDDSIRIISFRKANKREAGKYVKQTQ